MDNIVLQVKDLNVYYGNKRVVRNLNIEIFKNYITAVMGPSGCGKTTFIRTLNRMHEFTPNTKVEGSIILNGQVLDKMDPILVRRRIGMVFQKPNPFPTMNIHDNVIAGYILNGIRIKKSALNAIVEDCLTKAGLWEEVKDDLYKKGTFLSGGQQQRLCIARALAMKPDILLLDEPTSALDPVATAHIEELIVELKKDVTILLVTHNIAQAGRVSDYVTFMYLGELIEYGTAEQMFTAPKNEKTNKFLTGAIG
ncbi:MAG: phosphate ABC transporter ATP-binding protein [Spirochaetes bacterium]|nr:phosphate ABC transporter ATP-binding protein [Spirochaetota bacterium]